MHIQGALVAAPATLEPIPCLTLRKAGWREAA